MDYSEIKKHILYTTNELNSVVSVKDSDYTHIPSSEDIRLAIAEAIIALAEIQHKIKVDSWYDKEDSH